MHLLKVIASSTGSVLYMAFAAGLVHTDRTTSTGGFITLNGMVSFLVTFPISLPLELIDHKMDFRSNWQMTIIIALCGALVFGAVFGLWSFVEFLRASTPLAPR